MSRRSRDGKNVRLIRLPQNQIAPIMGLGRTTVADWARQYTDFPQPDNEKTFPVLDVIVWWICNKAPSTLQKQIFDSLDKLYAGERKDRAQIGRPPKEAKTKELDEHDRMMKELDLRSKHLNLQQNLKNYVARKQVKVIVNELARSLRGAQERFATQNGVRPGDVFGPSFAEFEQKLRDLAKDDEDL